MPRGIPNKAIRTISRGRTKKFATLGGAVSASSTKKAPKVAKSAKPKVARKAAAPRGRVSAKNVVLTKFDELLPVLERIDETQKLILKNATMQLELARAGLLDAFRQWAGQLASGNIAVDPSAFLKMFLETSQQLGVTVADLQREMQRISPAVQQDNSLQQQQPQTLLQEQPQLQAAPQVEVPAPQAPQAPAPSQQSLTPDSGNGLNLLV